MDSQGSPLQISLRPDANCRVMYGLDSVSASAGCKAGPVVVQPSVTTSAEPHPRAQGREMFGVTLGKVGVFQTDEKN